MNKVFLIGNLCNDPELTETSAGVNKCAFSIAVNRNYTVSDGERKADFFPCTAWRGIASTIAKYAKKGQMIAVIGSIEINNYVDKSGIKKVAPNVLVQDIEFLPTKQDTDSKPTAPSEETPDRQLSFVNNPVKKTKLQPFDEDMDIPF